MRRPEAQASITRLRNKAPACYQDPLGGRLGFAKSKVYKFQLQVNCYRVAELYDVCREVLRGNENTPALQFSGCIPES